MSINARLQREFESELADALGGDTDERVPVQPTNRQSITTKSLRALCVMSLCVLPFLLGGNIVLVQSLQQLIILSAAVWVASCSFRFSLPQARNSKKIDFVYVLTAAVLLFVSATIIPLPIQLLKLISPQAADGYQAVGASWGFISVNPYSTFQQFLWVTSLCLVVIWVREYSSVSIPKREVEGNSSGESLELEKSLPSSVFSSAIQMAGLFCGLVSILHWALGNDFYLGFFDPNRGELQSTRAHWPFVNPNHLAAFLEMGLVLSFTGIVRKIAVWKKHQNERLLESLLRLMIQPKEFISFLVNVIAFSLMLLAVFLSASKAGIVLTICGIGLLSVCAECFLISGKVGNSFKSLFAIGLCLFLILVVLSSDLGQNLVAARFEQGLVTRLDEARTHLYQLTIKLSLDFPITGVGLGNWQLIAPQYAPEYLAGFALDYAHNEYLQMIAELGYISSAILFVAAMLLVVRTLQVFLKVRGKKQFSIVASSLVLLLPLLHSLVDFPLHIPAIAFALAVQLGLHLNLLDSCSQPTSNSNSDLFRASLADGRKP